MLNARICRDIVLVQALASMVRRVRRSSLLIKQSAFPQKNVILFFGAPASDVLAREERQSSSRRDCCRRCRRDQRLA